MSSEAKKQALLNEYKGYLFEYFVALNLSIFYKLEAHFFTKVPSDLQNMLRIQESYIRLNYPELIKDLPILANELAMSIYSHLQLESAKSVDIVGKMIATPEVNEFAEADILISTEDKVIPISLKLSKAQAFVNTKSGGVKSFFDKYFSCEKSLTFQRELNKFVDEKFHEMAFSLHEIAGIDYPMHFKDWVANGLSELPGELSSDYKEVLHHLYYKLIDRLYEIFCALNDAEAEVFKNGLMSLCGVGNDHLVQATCFYKSKGKSYLLDKIQIDDAIDIKKEIKSFKIEKLRSNLAHFEISLPTRTLQIRIKPMNKFTSASFKVNCSVKKF